LHTEGCDFQANGPLLSKSVTSEDKFPLLAHVYVKDVSVCKEMQQKDQGTSVSQISL